jgi:hypothetical protein
MVLFLVLAIGCGLACFPLHAQTGSRKFTRTADGWWVIDSGADVNGVGGAVARLNVQSVWPDQVRQSPGGFLSTADGSPIRVLPAGYFSPLFEDPDGTFPGGVADVMKPFRAYYVVSRFPATGTPLVVQVRASEPPFLAQSPKYWVRLSDCFLWVTGLSAEIRKSTPVYSTREDALSASHPQEPNAKLTNPGQHPEIAAVGPPPPLSRLPVLQRTPEAVELVCPGYGGELCWVNISKSGANLVITKEQ